MSFFIFINVATAITFCCICTGELEIRLGHLNRIVKGETFCPFASFLKLSFKRKKQNSIGESLLWAAPLRAYFWSGGLCLQGRGLVKHRFRRKEICSSLSEADEGVDASNSRLRKCEHGIPREGRTHSPHSSTGWGDFDLHEASHSSLGWSSFPGDRPPLSKNRPLSTLPTESVVASFTLWSCVRREGGSKTEKSLQEMRPQKTLCPNSLPQRKSTEHPRRIWMGSLPKQRLWWL